MIYVNLIIVIIQNELSEDVGLFSRAIRAGDCLAMLVEFFYSNRQMEEAYKYLQEMEDRRIQLHPYLDADVIDSVYRAVGHKAGGAKKGPKAASKANNSAQGQSQLNFILFVVISAVIIIIISYYIDCVMYH